LGGSGEKGGRKTSLGDGRKRQGGGLLRNGDGLSGWKKGENRQLKARGKSATQLPPCSLEEIRNIKNRGESRSSLVFVGEGHLRRNLKNIRIRDVMQRTHVTVGPDHTN